MQRRQLTTWLARGLLVAVGAAGPAAWASRQPASSAPVVVQLLAINDLHGNLEPPAGGDGRVNGAPAGGAAFLAAHLQRAAADNPNSILVGAGDLVGASPLISAMFGDRPTIEALGAMGLAVSSVGNHEFDRGRPHLLELQKEARFQYLAANVVTAPEGGSAGAPLLPPTFVKAIGGVKIGFIGETLRGTPRIVASGATEGLRFLDEAATANAYARELDRAGVHAVVLLVHEGGAQRPSGPIDPNGCAGFGGSLTRTLERLSPAIKIVISGHTHQMYNCELGGRVVTSAGAYGRAFTRLTLTVDSTAGTITRATAVNQVVTRTVPPDAAQTAVIEKYRRLAAPVAGRVVGSTTADIVRRPNRAGESALGDVIADAQLAATAGPGTGGADVAFMNPGGIRADLVAAGDAGRAVTYERLFRVQPFGNRLTVATMTGAMIARLLEQQFRGGGATMLQVSRGFSYRYRLRARAGRHVDPASIALNGKPIAPDARLRVAASDYLASGGDGFTVFGEADDRVDLMVDVDALAAYFERNSPIAPGPQDRIVRLD